MALDLPAWLAQRGGSLTLASDQATWYVMFDRQPQYSLAPVPVAGKFGCVIKQTNNGERLNCTGVSMSADEALRAGLEDLRKTLGW